MKFQPQLKKKARYILFLNIGQIFIGKHFKNVIVIGKRNPPPRLYGSL